MTIRRLIDMIKVGIIGYGNLGAGVEQAISKQNDMEVFGIFTRRDKTSVYPKGASTVYHTNELSSLKGQIDVLIHCGSSEFDLRDQTPELAKDFNIVDSFDMHALIGDHIKHVDQIAKTNNKTAIVSVGWDPGIFSAHKTVMDAILPFGATQSFWGYGISQGHSNVASKVNGVVMARNYSVPNEKNIEAFKNHEKIDVSLNHTKECYVVAEKGADLEQIRHDILNIEHYFKGSATKVIFITEQDMLENHSQWSQGGRVIRIAETSEGVKHTLDFQIKLDSNPEFTASNLVAYARAAVKMYQRQEFGGFSALDVRPKDMSSKTYDQLIKEML